MGYHRLRSKLHQSQRQVEPDTNIGMKLKVHLPKPPRKPKSIQNRVQDTLFAVSKRLYYVSNKRVYKVITHTTQSLFNVQGSSVPGLDRAPTSTSTEYSQKTQEENRSLTWSIRTVAQSLYRTGSTLSGLCPNCVASPSDLGIITIRCTRTAGHLANLQCPLLGSRHLQEHWTT